MNPLDKQNQLYNMLEKLKILAKEIPPKYQLRLPYDVLSSLAHILLDNTVFEIVKELVDLQRMTEIHLHQQRQEIVKRHKHENDNLMKTHKEEVQKAICQGRTHVLQRLPTLHKDQCQVMETKHNQELANFDRRVLEIIDEKVAEQQSTLEQVGLPYFKVTTSVTEVKIQIYIIGFILHLGNIQTSCKG